MKKLLLSLLAFMISLVVIAGEVTEQQALQKAQQFMQGKQFKQKSLRRTATTTASKAYYIFNAEDNGGFVIVSGDDRTTEILGYSDKGNLDIDKAPDGLTWLLAYYDEVMKNWQHAGNSGTVAHLNRAERVSVAPLMITTWGQEYPYNLQCPQIGNSQCITGCVATAMAQIMNYCQWPEGPTTSIASYKTSANRIDVPTLEPTTFNWDYMNESELSKLMRYCGQSIEMDYGLNSSGAFTVLAADVLVNNFGYANTVKAVDHRSYTDEEWEELMYEEIAAKRAILFGGTNANGEDGHAFVIHGYDSGKFYINWGWDGIDDGYFALTGLMPDGTNFNYNQHAIIGIQPSSGIKNQPRHPVATTIMLSYREAISYNLRESNGAFPEYEVSFMVESSVTNQSIQIGCGLYNETGLQKVLFSEQHTFTKDEQYNCAGTVTLDASIPDGEYYIYPICRANNSDEWLKNVRCDVNCLKVSIHDDLRKIQAIRNWRNVADSDKRLLKFVGISKIDGIQYDLYEETGNKRAIVIPIKGGYSGDLIIPSTVNYQGDEYSVYEAARSSFSNCSELTSLETSMTYGPYVSSCPKLKQLIFKEGMKIFNESVDNCPLLEYIEFPQSAETVQPYFVAVGKLTTVRFKSPERLVVKSFFFDFGSNCSITDIYFHQTTPPEIPEGSQPIDINEWSDIITLHIPQGTKSLYESSIWKNFKLVDDIQIDYQTNKILWGYCQSTQNPNGASLDMKDLRGLDREFAIRVPSEYLAAYKNCKITAIQYFAWRLDMDVPDYVFVTKPGADYLSKETTQAIRDSWNTTILSTPIMIDGSELYIGIGRRDNIRVSYSTDQFVVAKGTLMARNMNPTGVYVSEDVPVGVWHAPDATTPVCIRFAIEGEDLPYDLLLNEIRIDNNELYAKVISRTPDYVNSFTLNWELDGNQKGSQEISSGLIPNGLGEYIIDLPSDLKGFNHDIRFEVGDINGKPDAIPENSNKTYSFELQPNTTYPRTAVMESLTGTWCGYSPRGTVGMQLLKQDFGDRFIPIAIHYANEFCSDIMYLPEYKTPIYESETVPLCYINRGKWIDPLLGSNIMPPYGIKDDVEKVLNQKSPVALGIETRWKDSGKTSIEITTSTVFGGDDEQIPYQLAYVLLEDGLHGEGEEWYQNNGISNDTGVAYGNQTLLEYVSLPGQLTDVKYDNVPVAAWGTMKGLEGTVPQSVKEGKIYKYTYDADIAGNTHIQNKENLSAVVLVLNKTTGAIVTATQCKVGESKDIPSPIKKVVITPITGTEETSFKETIGNETDLENTVIDNTYYNMDAASGDGYDATEQALVLNSTTTNAQMTAIQNAEVGDAAVKENYSGIIFEIPAGKGTITVDAKTVGTHVLNVQVGNGAPTKVQKSERGTADVEYNVNAPTYVYLYASTQSGSAARLDRAGTAGANSVLLYGYKVTIGGTGIQLIDKGQLPIDNYYDLNGRKVKTPRKGVYIIRGQKVVVK